MKKNLYHLLNLLLATTLTTGIGLAQYEPTSAPALKTFALDGDMTGAASNSVNLFTGDVALPLSLLSLPGRNGLDVNVAISYTSQVQQQVDKWNLEAPTGILGLGWNMDLPRIVCDHKQTGTRIDDEYYLVEGGSSNRLIRTTGGQDQQGHYYVYEPQNWQPWRVRYYYDGLEMGLGPQGPNMWEIVRDDGTIYKYGDRFSGRKTVQWLVRWGNWIGNSSQTQGQSQMAHIWNLSEVVNTWGERILFEYEQEEQFVGTTAGQKHTEA